MIHTADRCGALRMERLKDVQPPVDKLVERESDTFITGGGPLPSSRHFAVR